MKNNKSISAMVIFFDADKKCRQIVKPRTVRQTASDTVFDGNWNALATTIAGSNGYHSFELI